MVNVENDCFQVITQVLDVIESDECGSVRNDMNKVDVNESGPVRVLMDVFRCKKIIPYLVRVKVVLQ